MIVVINMDHFIHFIYLCSIIKHLFPPFRVGIPLSPPPYMGIFTLENVNAAYDQKEARREYMRAWRIAHGQGGPPGTSYMSQKGREARERRREAMEVGGGV